MLQSMYERQTETHAQQQRRTQTRTPTPTQPPEDGEVERLAAIDMREQISWLIHRVVPEESNQIDEILIQFQGQEEELLGTLRTMHERAIARKRRARMRRNSPGGAGDRGDDRGRGRAEQLQGTRHTQSARDASRRSSTSTNLSIELSPVLAAVSSLSIRDTPRL
mmetsp:Transcript_59260/g.69290  ORF Transcript_59260/g.69290 Transcript_59260/m.69290 type:complete len:165 (+) Transcript_59260:231-725(+)